MINKQNGRHIHIFFFDPILNFLSLYIEEVQDILRPTGDVRPGGGGGAGVVVPVLEDRAAEPGDEAPGK